MEESARERERELEEEREERSDFADRSTDQSKCVFVSPLYSRISPLYSRIDPSLGFIVYRAKAPGTPAQRTYIRCESSLYSRVDESTYGVRVSALEGRKKMARPARRPERDREILRRCMSRSPYKPRRAAGDRVAVLWRTSTARTPKT
jgi:hypothetical protein